VEGLYFSYKHFWGDYNHYMTSCKWYKSEVRIIRDLPGVESVGDAQSFRINNRKLRAADSGAEMFHYGYVRPPDLMQRRRRYVNATYYGEKQTAQLMDGKKTLYDYGSLEKVPVFKGTHPTVMAERIKKMDWSHLLQYKGPSKIIHKHDRLKYRVRTFIEQKILGGHQLFGYRGYKSVR
jgi:hypothetical protein